MKTAKQLKEEKRQSYLKSNQLNVNLIKKLDKLPTGETVISISIENKHTWIICDSGKTYKSINSFINNEPIAYIEFSIYTHQDLKNLKKEFKLTNSDIAEIVGLKVDSVKNQTQPNEPLPTWAKAMIFVWKKQKE